MTLQAGGGGTSVIEMKKIRTHELIWPEDWEGGIFVNSLKGINNRFY